MFIKKYLPIIREMYYTYYAKRVTQHKSVKNIEMLVFRQLENEYYFIYKIDISSTR